MDSQSGNGATKIIKGILRRLLRKDKSENSNHSKNDRTKLLHYALEWEKRHRRF